MSDFFRNIVESLKDDETSMAIDGLGSAECSGYISTGCYALNALLSGTIFGGMANNRCTAFVGDPATGKTFFVLSILQNFLAENETGGAAYYDTESATSRKMMSSRGIDVSRVILSEPTTVQDFRTKVLNFLAEYAKSKPKDRPPLLMALDSLGMLSTLKEMTDAADGKDTRDMTKAQLIKGAFRILRLKMAKLQVPMLVTNHLYAGVGQYAPPKVISGGSGLIYAADGIMMISKSKDKDGTEIVGNILTVKSYKSRLSRENQEVKLKLSYDTGLDPYYGLSDIAMTGGIFEKAGPMIRLPDGRKVYGKTIDENPEEVFTKDVLLEIDVAARRRFAYGTEDEQLAVIKKNDAEAEAITE